MTDEGHNEGQINSHPQVGDSSLHKKLSQMIDDLNNDVLNDLEKTGVSKPDVEITSDERQYLIAVEGGDVPTVKSMMDNRSSLNLNVNCSDSLGRNALHIAIENELLEMLQILLDYNLEIGDALLHSISEESVEAVEIILRAQDERPKKKDLSELLGNASSVYTSDITPLILASHRDNYPIIKILLDRGDTISKPHDLRCSCHECDTSQKEDSLRYSRSKINAYKALASPSLICLSSKDPILTAFELSWELERLGKLENEFMEDYEKLSSQCQQFARDLISQTRGSSELVTVLNHDHGQVIQSTIIPIKVDADEFDNMSLARLKLAIKYEQKSFIAHPHCQQLLASLWYDGLPGIRRMSFINQTGLIALICSSFPILSFIYIVAPESRFGRLLKKPFITFLCHQSSFLFFLLLITISSMKMEFVIFGGYVNRINDRGPPPSIIEWPIIIYVAGFVWKEIKELYTNGLKAYVSDMWNLLDFGTSAIYVATIVLRVSAYVNVYNHQDRFVYRGNWDSFEPVLISECLFAGANIISTLKLVFVFTISPTLGPLQISLGRMLGDILNFSCLYLLVLVAYAIGFHELYWFYSNERSQVCQNMQYTYQSTGQDLERYQYCTFRGRYFTNIFEISQALYWSAYGLIDVSNLNLEHQHVFTEFIGKFMFGSFCYITIIMLLNMFIAMMNNSYQIIAEKADMEWKFARSRLWMSYFKTGETLPVPFNMIPTPKSFYYFYMATKQLLCGCMESQSRSKWKSIRKLVKKVNEDEARHHLVMKDLVKRYLIYRQKSEDTKGVTEDDLNEIKGDISSFRYELLEILKMNGMNIPAYVNSKTTGRLRRKGSKKGLNRIMRKLNLSKYNSHPKEPSKDKDNNLKTVVERASGKKFISFENNGFQSDEKEFHISKTLLATTISEEVHCEENSGGKSQSQTPQPLNASELLEECSKNYDNYLKVSHATNSRRQEKVENVSVTDQRSDMV